MTAPAVPRAHVPALAVIVKLERAHSTSWQLEWRGPLGNRRSGQWYATYAEAHAMAESCGAAGILDE